MKGYLQQYIFALVLIAACNILSANNKFYYLDNLDTLKLNLIAPAYNFGDSLIFLNLRLDTINGNKHATPELYIYNKPIFQKYIYKNIVEENNKFPFYLNCIVKDNDGNIFLGTDVGVIKFNGTNFTLLKGYDYNARKIFLYHDTLYAAGNFKYLAKFNGEEFEYILPDTTGGGDIKDWLFVYSQVYSVVANRFYFINASYRLAYCDLNTGKFYKSTFNSLEEIVSNYSISNLKVLNDKLFLIVLGYSLKENIINVDEENPGAAVIDSSIQQVIPDSVPYSRIIDIFEDMYGNRIFNLECPEDVFIFVDKNKKMTNMGRLKPSPIYNTVLTISNVLNMPAGQVFYSLSGGGGFLVYDPSGTGVNQTEEVSTIMVYNAYPNPTRSTINLLFLNWTKKVEEIKTELYNYLGQCISILRPEEINIDDVYGYGTMQLDLTGIPNGAYYLVVKNKNDMVTIPVVKE